MAESGPIIRTGSAGQRVRKAGRAPPSKSAPLENKEIVASVNKINHELQAALATPSPNEAKLKELVKALTTGQDKLFASFNRQRDEELALMTPAEQAKYLILEGQWRQKFNQQAAGGKK